MLKKVFLLFICYGLFFNVYAHDPGLVRKIFKVLGLEKRLMALTDSINELAQKPQPLDEHIIRHAKQHFGNWSRFEKLYWLSAVFPYTDAQSVKALVKVAVEYDLLLDWDEFAIKEGQTKIREALSGEITQLYWQYTCNTTPDGTITLLLKDLRNGSACIFSAPCGNIIKGGQLAITRMDSDIIIGIKSDGYKTLFTLRRDARTNLWFEAGSYQEEFDKTPAITSYKEIKTAPVCVKFNSRGIREYRRFRLKDSVRKYKIWKLTTEVMKK
ncbi:MAG: hypothetical protein E7051_00110 [Lentisphaerae bacterium]|nr:hypothetical protein [Lentisphaerota bacterium]